MILIRIIYLEFIVIFSNVAVQTGVAGLVGDTLEGL
jgi:hypothetical protein